MNTHKAQSIHDIYSMKIITSDISNKNALLLFEQEVQRLCQTLQIGKRLPNALYLHYSTIDQWPRALRDYEAIARAILPDLSFPIILIKFNIL